MLQIQMFDFQEQFQQNIPRDPSSHLQTGLFSVKLTRTKVQIKIKKKVLQILKPKIPQKISQKNRYGFARKVQRNLDFLEDSIKNFEYMRYRVKFCTKCKNTSDVQDIVQKFSNISSDITISLFFINQVINTNDAHLPFKPFVDRYFHFQFNPLFERIQSNIYFRQYVINDYMSIFDQTTFKTTNLMYNENSDKDQLTNFQPFFLPYLLDSNYNNKSEIKSFTIATIFLRRSEYTTIGNRYFETISECLSYFGGLIQFVLMIVSYFLTYYNRFSYLKTISNTSYRFVDFQELKELKKTKLYSSFKDHSKELIIMQHANLISKFSERFRVKLFHYWYFICRLSKDYLQQRRSLKIAMEIVARDFDVFRVIRMMHDVERIKYIIFSQEEYKLFNCLPKPNICVFKDQRGQGCFGNIQEIGLDVINLSDFANIEPPVFRQMFDSFEMYPRYFQMTYANKQLFDRENSVEFYRMLEVAQLQNNQTQFNQKLDGLLNSSVKSILVSIMSGLDLQDSAKKTQSSEKLEFSFPAEYKQIELTEAIEKMEITNEVLTIIESPNKYGTQDFLIQEGKRQFIQHFFPGGQKINIVHPLIQINIEKKISGNNLIAIVSINNQTSSQFKDLNMQFSPNLIQSNEEEIISRFLPKQSLTLELIIKQTDFSLSLNQNLKYPFTIKMGDIVDFYDESLSLVPTIHLNFLYDQQRYRYIVRIPDWFLSFHNPKVAKVQLEELLRYQSRSLRSNNIQQQINVLIPKYEFGQIQNLIFIGSNKTKCLPFRIDHDEEVLSFYFEKEVGQDTRVIQHAFTLLVLSFLFSESKRFENYKSGFKKSLFID